MQMIRYHENGRGKRWPVLYIGYVFFIYIFIYIYIVCVYILYVFYILCIFLIYRLYILDDVAYICCGATYKQLMIYWKILIFYILFNYIYFLYFIFYLKIRPHNEFMQ